MGGNGKKQVKHDYREENGKILEEKVDGENGPEDVILQRLKEVKICLKSNHDYH